MGGKMKTLLLTLLVVLAFSAGAEENDVKVAAVTVSEERVVRVTKSDWETVQVEEKGERTSC
jgi:hypothetical protein